MEYISYTFDAGTRHSTFGHFHGGKLCQVEDPLGGSWSTHVYIKSLSNDVQH